jgi:predicted O-linked N-acetylglucosamine transferase (SPINDLY family)
LDNDPDYDFAKGNLLYQKMLTCDWGNLRNLIAEIQRDIAAGKKAIEPFCLPAVSNSLSEIKQCAEIYRAAEVPAPETKLWTGERYHNSKIRLGYVSGDLRSHAVARLMVEVFERHDKNRFELWAFDNGADDGSDTRQRINAVFDHVVNIRELGGSYAAKAINDQKIEVLVNLDGYSGRGRTDIFARRPAPIQVNYLGFSATMGADFMDYIVADRSIIPSGAESFYSEKVVYLPDCYQPSDSQRVIARQGPGRSDLGLPAHGFVFCCFNNSFKITPDIFDIWMRLLAQIADSVLWLPFDTELVMSNLRREAEARSISSERIIFSSRASRLDEYFARYRLADLFLDNFPFNAGATANDALWAGLPLLTCSGETYTARMAGSLLRTLDVPELIAHSLADYESLATRLATDRNYLASLREKLQQNAASGPLFDMKRFTLHLEAAYEAMWRQYQAGLAPKSFEIDRIQ